MRSQTTLLYLSNLILLLILILSHSAHASPASCPLPQLSCHQPTPSDPSDDPSDDPPDTPNSCCVLTPGGLLLQTQYWDYSPSIGPKESWTLHGLWPDKCDGSWEEYCDPARAYKNITDIISAVGTEGEALLKVMQAYWVPDRGSAEEFWEHEWAKHGTCVSTLNPSCYTDYVPQEEVVFYFNITVQLFLSLNTFDMLSAASIVPHPTKRYARSAVESALSDARGGYAATVSCDKRGAIQQAWYYFNVNGSVQTGEFVPSQPDGSKGKCPEHVMYLPKYARHRVVGGGGEGGEMDAEGDAEGEEDGREEL